jgi:hypothetical protein
MLVDSEKSSDAPAADVNLGPRRWSRVIGKWVMLALAAAAAAGSSGAAFAQAAPASAAPSASTPADPVVGFPAAPATTDQLASEKAAREGELRALRAELQGARQEMQEALSAERAQRAADGARLRAEVGGWRAEAARQSDLAAQAPPTLRAAQLGVGLTGFLQADLAFRQSSENQINPSTGDPLNEDRITIRRARLKATLDRTYVAGLFELDGNTVKGPTARIAGAEASLRWPGAGGPAAPPLIMGTLGLFKIPFGFEVGQSDRDRLFLERSTTSRALFPGEYDLGARLQGGWRFIRYALAAQNGEPIGERSFPARDPNNQKDFVGRLGVDGGEGPVSIAAGFSALAGTGFHKGSPATKPSTQWIDSNEDGIVDATEIRASPGLAATPSLNFPRHGLGADLRVTVRTPRLGETTVYGELYYAKDLDRGILPADPTGEAGAVGRSYRELGWYLAVMQDLGAHATVGARYDYYNPDRDAGDRQAGIAVPADASYSTLGLVAALRAPFGRLIVEYDINRNHLGRDAAGLPTTLADNAFTLRGEVRF